MRSSGIRSSSVRPRRDHAEIPEDVLGVRPRLAPLPHAAELAVEQLVVQVQERETVRLDPLGDDVREERP